RIPERTPFVGKNFNVTRAGIHADGLLKNEEIYNIFDTEKYLKRPALCAISNTSGLAGIAHWINQYFKLSESQQVDKNSPMVKVIKEWVDKEYESGRVTVVTEEEILTIIQNTACDLGIDLKK
ncbi:MAG: 2-isopropylmalate synthase, partial [Lachnospiraceae bacterium]|nr:2-isopropylmalate synthase [Lachnospiraceae bacterium]